jgi:hypothetical protein
MIHGTREGERLWNDHNVDKNLADAWLDALNSLRTYNLISICEGHIDGGRGPNSTRPHLNLRIKENFLPIFVKEFDSISNELHTKMVELFGEDDTNADLEFKVKLTSSRVRQEIRRDLAFHAEARFSRQSIEMEQDVVVWFNKTIKKIRMFDDVTQSLLAERCNHDRI